MNFQECAGTQSPDSKIKLVIYSRNRIGWISNNEKKNSKSTNSPVEVNIGMV